MPGSLRKMPVWLPIVILLVAMASIQGGASLAKSLFPLVGAPGVTALRLALGTLILIAFFKPWRLRFAKEQRLPLLFYGVSLGGMNYLFYLSILSIIGTKDDLKSIEENFKKMKDFFEEYKKITK